jgi:type IV pilus assembly protein PilV
MKMLFNPLSRTRILKPVFTPAVNSQRIGRGNNSLGFTLIEVLMAAAILGIGLLGVAALIVRASVQDVRAVHFVQGGILVEDFLESATRAQYSFQAFNALADTNVSSVIDGVRYSMNCTLTDDTPVERCKEMSCVLSWNTSGSQASAHYVYVFSPKF